MSERPVGRRGAKGVGAPIAAPLDAAALDAILSAVRSATGHDFHGYKPGTLQRRIRRRMGLLQLADPAEYARRIEAGPVEAAALRRDLLIGVTDFFRQPEAWRVLGQQVLGRMADEADDGALLRAWVPGCASGKEAYSLAMLLAEQERPDGRVRPFQVFATDADEAAIEAARAGVYDEAELASVSPERVQRFFTRRGARFQVARALRDRVVFACHDLTADPPFSRMDLVSCRNLLIYLDGPAQQGVLARFHRALREGGCLFLGAAEGVGSQVDLFEALSVRWRIFRKVPVVTPPSLDLPSPPRPGARPAAVPASRPARSRPPLSALARQAVADRFGPPAAVVDRRGTLLYLHGPVDPFVKVPAGEQTGLLIDAAREGLRNRLLPALLRAVREGKPVSLLARVGRGRTSRPVRVTVSPLLSPPEADGLLLVTFEKRKVGTRAALATDGDTSPADIARVEGELRATEAELSDTIAQLSLSNDCLRASNEEETSANEELQATNEELETSQEELQCLNDELATVNRRLNDKVAELERATEALRASEQQARWLGRFPDENPNPVVRVAADGTVLYGNTASLTQRGWRCEAGAALPEGPLRSLLARALVDGRPREADLVLDGNPYAVAVAPVPAEGYANLYGRDITDRVTAQEALRESEARVRRTLESVLSPEGDPGTLELAELVDVPALQALMEDFHAVTRVPMALLDTRGKVLVGVGWQDICTAYHRVNPEMRKNCLESDTVLSAGLGRGECRLYKCRNHLWDMATPVVVAGRHAGNVFTGQFFLEDEAVDREFFRAQAQRFGLDEAGYLAALDRVPRLAREVVDRCVAFLRKLADMLSRLGHSNVQLARLVAERDRLAASLRDGAQRLKRAQEIARLGSWELDLDRNELTWSDEVYRIFGLQPQEFAATYENFLAHVHPDDRAAVDGAYTASVRDGKDGYEIEHRVVRAGTGEVRFVEEKCEHVRDPSGRILRSVGMVHDITERKRAEDALRGSEQRLRLFIGHAPAALAMFDRQMRYVAASRRWLGDYGLDGREVLGVSHYEVFPEVTEAWREVHRRGLMGEVVRAEDDRFVRADGSVQWLRWEVRPWFDDDGQAAGIVVFTEDVTDLKQAEQRLRQLNESLEARVAVRTFEVRQQADRLRALAMELTQTEQRERQRLARILHDHLQQLLVAAQMRLSLVPRADPPTIQATAKAVGSLIHEALDLSRSLTVELFPPVLQQAGLVAALSWLANRMDEQHQFKVCLEAASAAEPANPEVRAFVFEAVRELLLNAVKHSGAREARLVMSATDDGCCRVTVQDGGRGFDPEPVVRSACGGFGLFSIQQRLMHLDGSLEIDSAPGRGTLACLTVPLGAATQAAVPPAVDEPNNGGDAAERKAGHRVSILVVDDHAIVREGLASLLALETDLEVVGEAADGLAALEMARRHRPDVVVMDVNLPHLDGIAATRALTREMPGIRVVGLSMHADAEAAQAMREAGAAAYVTKGGPSERLVAAIRGDA